MRVRAFFSRTISVRQYEPERVELELEYDASLGSAGTASAFALEIGLALAAAGDALVAERLATHSHRSEPIPGRDFIPAPPPVFKPKPQFY